MKKKILSLALIAMSFVAFGANAQTPAAGDSGKAQQECTAQGKKDGKKCDKKGKKDGDSRKCDSKGKKCSRKGDRPARVNPFDGLNLTETQQAQLKQLGEKRMAERRQQAQSAKESKQRNDSVRFAARLQSKRDYLTEVKAIVGPENYVIFLENAYVNGAPIGHKDAKWQKGDKDRRHSDKADKQGRHDRGGKDRGQKDGSRKDGARQQG